MNVFEKNKNIPIELHLPIDFHFGFFENNKSTKTSDDIVVMFDVDVFTLT